MKRNWSYFKYVMRHKWFVLVASWRIGASLWRAIVHDLSKFYPSEWKPYAFTFYDDDGNSRYDETEDFNQAWNHHQKRNKHHWQYWLLKMDRGEILPLPMPRKYILEMAADWMGAGRAITGEWEAREWYSNNKDKIQLASATGNQVRSILAKHG